MQKEYYRKKYKELRSNYKNKSYSDNLIEKNLFSWTIYKNSKNIMTFVSFSSEVNTHNIIKHSLYIGKNIFIPHIDPINRTINPVQIFDFNDLVLGEFNILSVEKGQAQAIDAKKLDLILVPGLVFDKNGHRIGYGGGYYDRFLSKIPSNIVLAGLAYDFQKTSSLKHESYDQAVDFLITDKKIYSLNR